MARSSSLSSQFVKAKKSRRPDGKQGLMFALSQYKKIPAGTLGFRLWNIPIDRCTKMDLFYGID